MPSLHTAPDRGPIKSCQTILTAICDIEDAAKSETYSKMSFTEVMDAIADLDACTGEVTQGMLRDRAVLELVKQNMFDRFTW